MEELLNLSLLRTGGLDIKLSDEYEKSPVSSEQVAVFKYDKNQSNKASFELKSDYKWVIDTNYFTGSPILEVNFEQNETIIHISLKDAYYPGTKIRADFYCTVKKICKGHILQLTLFNNKFYCEILLEDWLTNLEIASSTIFLSNLNPAIFSFNNTSCKFLENEVRVEFFPDWSINLIGEKVAVFSHMYHTPHYDYVIADKVRIELPNSTGKSLFLNQSFKRTKIFMSPTQEQYWLFHEELFFEEGWSINLPIANENLFDQIYIEIDVNQKGKKRFLILARPYGQKKDISLTFINQKGEESLLIPFQRIYYILGFNGNDLQRLIMGRFSSDGGWCHSNGCSVLLGDGPSAKLLELDFINLELKRAIIEPAVLAISAPLIGVITEAKLSGNLNSSVILMEYQNYSVLQNLQGQIQIELKRKYSAPIIRIPEKLSISIIRPKDLLALQFEFINLAFVCGGNQGKIPHLQRTKKKEPSYLIVHFPPQHIAEEVFCDDKVNSPIQPIQSRLSEPSRLVFKLPDKSDSILYSLDKLLNWKFFEQSVSPRAITLKENDLTDFLSSNPSVVISTVEQPSIEHTAIEAPYRLVISPNSFAGWAHAVSPVSNKGITELWHTRLGVRDGTNIDENNNILRTIRAIWSRYEDIPNPFTMSLDHMHRKVIVQQTAAQTPNVSNSCLPVPVNVERLMLSSLGIWMDVQGNWSPENCQISSWQHQTAMGRDSYVKVVEEGFLFPLCNRASLVQITERKFKTENKETRAYLYKRYFVIVRELEIDYPSTGISGLEFKCPIKKVSYLTRVTPDLNIDCYGKGGPSNREYIEIIVNNQPFPFHIIAEDCNGNETEIAMPLAFVSQTFVNGSGLDNLVAGYHQDVGMGGQKISYAKSNEAGDTAFVTNSFTFGAEVLPISAIDQHPSRFYPVMKQADVRIEAVEQIAGPIGYTSIKMNPIYLENGFDVTKNAGEIFVDLVNEVGLEFPVNKSGGLTSPNMTMVAVSRFLGPIGGTAGLNPRDRATELACKALGEFDPQKYFNQQAKILGSILLEEIIEAVDFKMDVPKDRFPQLKSEPIYPDGNTNALPIAIETKMNWKPKLKSYEIFQVEEGDQDQSSLNVDVKIYTDLQIPSNSSYEITGELKNFKIVLAPGDEDKQFLILYFHQLVFKTRSGQKPVIIPGISNIEFKGVLNFIEKMKDFMTKIDDSPSIDISSSGVMVNKIIPIPDIEIGAIMIQKIILFNQLYLPFDNSPLRFRFSLSTRENPFLITVGAYGGGGFFGIALGVDGVEFLEAALEFGGVKALRIGPATGDVHLMAGIYFKKGSDTCELTGYVRCGGALAVLGVTVSAEFYLGLNYDFKQDRVWGVATLTVKVDFHFFSKSVELHCEKEFKKEPELLDNNTIEESQWIEYCDAFA
ncbi:hypothetical protein [Lysinibacillus sphaericus]|uniref:hypothetical protein n=1 Tax=Lysinibacillus sphaericus TaxID=1421 RepID=UPI0005621580|nr:hypothetical protein [Lysinibacillus sphaericus]